MSVKNKNIENKFVVGSLVLFILLMLFSWIIGYQEEIKSHYIWLQLLFGCSYYFILLLAWRLKSVYQLIFLVFVYTLFFEGLLRMVFWETFSLPYGDAVDSYNYEYIVNKNITKDYFTFLKSLFNVTWAAFNVDDIGYPSLLWVIFNMSGGTALGRNIMLVVNSCFICIATLYLYKILRILSIDNKYAMFVSSIYGFLPFLFVTGAVGLKENVFCLLVILSLWNLYSWKFEHRFTGIIWACVFICLTYFFRFAISLMLILVAILTCLMTDKNRKQLVYMAFAGLFVAFFVGPFVIEKFTGIPMDLVFAVADSRNNRIGGGEGSMGQFIQILAALFGPFPNFTRTVQYGIYHSSGLLLKSMLSIPVLISFGSVLKKYDYKYYPAAAFLLMGWAMLILGGVALDFRYAVIFFSAFLILFARYLQLYTNKALMWLAQIPVICIIIFYNFR